MPDQKKTSQEQTAHKAARQELIDALNEDLAREYQAIIAYVVYSQVLKGAQYMNIAGELETHAAEELASEWRRLGLKRAIVSSSRSVRSPVEVSSASSARMMLRW